MAGGTLVYPVRWGRAEDLAITLEPYLQSLYGPGVRVVPQSQSNKLLIYVPPRREREIQRRPASYGARSNSTPVR